MNLHFTEASALAIIDRQLEGLKNFSPSQYEIVRQVIYHTGDLQYQSLLRFSETALAKGAAALTARTPIIVDVPEIQVKIVPRIRQTFSNPVCCCTTNGKATAKKTPAANGLEALVRDRPNSIIIIGQDETTMATAIELIKSKAIAPSLAILTPPTFIEPDPQKWLTNSDIPYITVDGDKGGANVASAIFNGLLSLTSLAYQEHSILNNDLQ